MTIHDKFGSDQLTMVDLYRMVVERFDRSDKQFDELMENIRVTNHCSAGLEHEAWQLRNAREADVKTIKKIRKRTEGTAAADRTKYNGDSSFARRIDDSPTSLTCFGMIAKPPLALEKCIGDALVSKGAEAPKPHLPPEEVGILSSAADGLLSTGAASPAMRSIFPQPCFSWSLSEETKRRTDRTKFNQLAPPCWRRVI